MDAFSDDARADPAAAVTSVVPPGRLVSPGSAAPESAAPESAARDSAPPDSAAPESAAPGFDLSGPATPVPQLLADVWRSRAVLVILARKDFLARYRRTSLGLLWALGLPVLQAAVLTVVFTRVGNFSHIVQTATSTRVSYVVFVYAGIVGWSYFAQTLTAASTAIVDNVTLASKIYFPRLTLPLVTVVTGAYPLGVSLALLLAMAALLQHVGVAVLWVLPGALLAVAVTAGFGMLLSAMHVYFRDVRYIVQAAMVALFYATPVIYSLSTAPGRLRTVLTYGPMAGPIELFRLATGSADAAWPYAVATAAGWFVVTAAAGVYLHSRFDRVFVDRM